MRSKPFWFAIAAIAFGLAISSSAVANTTQELNAPRAEAQDSRAQDLERHFVMNVLPVLEAKCFACHGKTQDEIRGDYDMTTRRTIIAGGESGLAAILPGKASDSPLIEAIKWEGLEMPPKENDRLQTKQIEVISAWIEDGAIWPPEKRINEIKFAAANEANAETAIVNTTRGLDSSWDERRYKTEDLWAYQPLSHSDVESIPQFKGSPIDAFIDQKLDELKLPSAPRADRRILIRRATFDLLGLPPTIAEVDSFVNDPRSDQRAFADVIDRLLASPHYGEQWGRHWLDVVRYADSSGFANDYERGTAWRYRDYVVRAFNEDKPYDQFVREQLAGDELDPDSSEALIASGFLRMGPWELTGMEVAQVARQRFLDDVTDAVGQVFLGQMLQCARCHDHKFDPIPTRDYYSMQAVFATTQLAEREAAFVASENTNHFDENRFLQQRRQHYQKTLAELESKRTLEAARQWYSDNDLDSQPLLDAIESISQLPNQSEQTITVDQIRQHLIKQNIAPDLIPPRHVGFAPRDFGLERVARKGLERLVWRQQRYQPIAMSVYSGPTPNLRSVYRPLQMPALDQLQGSPDETCILIGGDPFSTGEAVPPFGLSLFSETLPNSSELPSIPETISGRRTALAEWIVHPENPLASRVIANRIWQWHFGNPLAGNPNNFGATGGKPTHPELLDWLAHSLMENNWSIKSLHRIIMSSDAYCRSSSHPDPDLLNRTDSNRELLSVFTPRRLEAEEIRDSMRFCSGELNLELGGIPVRPEMNQEAAFQPRQVMGTFAEAWQPSPAPEQRHRRAIYALRLRGLTDPFLNVFNAPSSDTSCEIRGTSTITPQVFALFNSEDSYLRSLALANRIMLEAPDNSNEEKIDRLFELALGRSPSTQEQRQCLEHWQAMNVRHRELTFSEPHIPSVLTREAIEENTGERFRFDEPLEFYREFEPDLQPYQLSPETRALAEVALVLFNSNEFMFVY